MKKQLLLAALMFCLIIAGCKKTDSGSSSGTKMFWSNQSGSNITVRIDGGTYSGTISSYYNQTTAPDCGSSGCYSVTLSGGTHTYTATDGTHNWSGSFTMSSGCNSLLLYF